MARHVEMEDPTPIVSKDHEHEQDSARQRRHREEIDRDGRLEVVHEEGAPALRRWLLPPRHQPRNRSLRDREPQFQQLSMDPRRAPEWVREGHLSDQAPDLGAGLRATAARSRSACPVPRETTAMPRHHRGRSDDHQG